ncbi:S-adenosyl-L-methionine-dependent methyltransferase [Boletus edulis]|nr:S-adenosyl-L-methionine-dependent methyltransferase [Boletus edulis]
MSQTPQDPHAQAHHHDNPHQPHPPHPHPHAHQPLDGIDYETANKQHFDGKAHNYDDQHDAHRYAEVIGQAMKNTGLFKQGITTVMDFACGTGLISRVLAAEDPKLIVGVDISQGMVDQYNKIVSDHGIPPEEMRAICVTPREKTLEGLQDMTFDVIVCSVAYHHLSNIEEVTDTLATYLNPGGSLLVVDILHEESTHEMFPEEYHHIVAHKGGFTEQEIRSTFEKAGLKDITFEIAAHLKFNGHPVDLFLARGDKIDVEG